MKITEKFVDESDQFHLVTTQETGEIIKAAQGAAETFRPNTGPVGSKYLGTVPVVIAQQWATACGAAIGTKEWAAYARKQLASGEYSRFKVHMR